MSFNVLFIDHFCTLIIEKTLITDLILIIFKMSKSKKPVLFRERALKLNE